MSKLRMALLLAGLSSSAASAAPVVEEREWAETFDVGQAAAVSVANVWGNVTVEPGRSDRIELAIRSIRRADDQVSFDRSLEQIPLRIGQDGDEVALRVGRDWDDWRTRERCRGCELRLDILVKVPRNASIDVRTVNDGDVVVRDIDGVVTASNVNGSVRTTGLSRCEFIETINGDLEVSFGSAPAMDCHLETLNGDIELNMAQDANVSFAVDLVNGKIRSEMDITPSAVPATVKRTTRDGRNHYEIEQAAGFDMGRGGKTLTLKSLNGDVLIERS